jgi:competence protein ComFC
VKAALASLPGREILRTGVDSLLDLLYPPRCLLCGLFGPEYLCESCASSLLTPRPDPICRRCGHSIAGTPCHHCAERRPAFVRSRSAGLYAGDLRLAIHLLKYRDKIMLADPLGKLLAGYAKENSRALHGLVFDAVVPVPMHPVRRRQRGYNHSERLAKAFAGEIGLALDSRILRRVRNTHPQVGFEREERLTNLAGAFVAEPARCVGKTFLLIDDVSTTGSTLHECAIALRAAGAKRAYALTLAAG